MEITVFFGGDGGWERLCRWLEESRDGQGAVGNEMVILVCVLLG